jgi:hypothetical protein
VSCPENTLTKFGAFRGRSPASLKTNTTNLRDNTLAV